MIELDGFEREGKKQVGLVEGVALELSEGVLHRGSSDSEAQPFTRLVGAAVSPLLFTVRVEFESAFSRVGGALGAQDVETGDEAFDETFVVKASDEGLVLHLLGPEVRAAFKATPDTLAVDYQDGLITATWWGYEEDPRMLQAVLTLVVALGSVSPPPDLSVARVPRRVNRPSARAERRRRLREGLEEK